MDLKEIQEMVCEVSDSPTTENKDRNISRAQLLASWVIAEQLAKLNDSLYRLFGTRK